MADPRGFITTQREVALRRPVAERIDDWKEVYPGTPGRALLPIITKQAGRCMDCGIPFCHQGCPLGNLVPEWNDLAWRGEWQAALERLHATNNFPEFTGRLCPAPCESACVVGINRDPVTIKNVEVSIIDKAWDDLRVTPEQPAWHTARTVAVVGSGPAGLAVAQQLTRVGHTVVVYERDDRIGGLLRYGIPEFKLEKHVLDRRLRQMLLEGTQFKPGVNIGVDITWAELRHRFDSVVIATGATVPWDLRVPGRELAGIHQAMEYLPQGNREALGEEVPEKITAAGKDVVIIGGGDTGADCLGTAIRQGARSVTMFRRSPAPPTARQPDRPWPTDPMLLEVASAHEEGGERLFRADTLRFTGADGHVSGLDVVEVERRDGRFQPVDGSERHLEADLVLMAMGFQGPETDGIVSQLGLDLDGRNVARDVDYATNAEGVFVCGDAGRGQSLIVWAIAEGRACAAAVDAFLQGRTSLPRPVSPTDCALEV